MLVAALAAAGTTPDAAAGDAALRVRRAERRLERDPGLWPVRVELAAACVDRARETGDPAWLARAEDELLRSLETQPNHEALKRLGMLAAFRHRFDEALEWAAQAARSLPTDDQVLGLRVEALMALGRDDEARAIVPDDADSCASFHACAALGEWLASRERTGEATRALQAASDAALAAGAPELAAWALVRAAGCHIDTGDPEGARPWLDASRAIDPRSSDLLVHEAEIAEAEGRPAAALRLLERALRGTASGDLHRVAARLAREAGDDRAAVRHFAIAEDLMRRALEAGEVYPLASLARLYLEAGVRLDDAEELARRAVEERVDPGASDLLADVVRARSGPVGG